MEVYNLTQQKRSLKLLVLGILLAVVCLISLVLMTAIWFMFPVACLCGAGAWFLIGQCDMEYEISYFGGELRFARIRHKSARKELGTCQMEQVLAIATADSHQGSAFLRDKSFKVKNYSSMVKNRPFQLIAVKDGEKKTLYKVELEKEILEAIAEKYAFLLDSSVRDLIR